MRTDLPCNLFFFVFLSNKLYVLHIGYQDFTPTLISLSLLISLMTLSNLLTGKSSLSAVAYGKSPTKAKEKSEFLRSYLLLLYLPLF